MRAVLLAIPILASILFLNGLAVQAEPLAGLATSAPAEAPAVHVQPRAADFQPRSPASEAEQKRLSVFDAKQQKLDEALDRKLSICRC
jgi:hypothetical protein